MLMKASDAAAIEKQYDFRKELIQVINKYSKENSSNTPDIILGEYLESCLLAFDTAVQQRETWYGRDSRPSVPGKDISELKKCKICNDTKRVPTTEQHDLVYYGKDRPCPECCLIGAKDHH